MMRVNCKRGLCQKKGKNAVFQNVVHKINGAIEPLGRARQREGPVGSNRMLGGSLPIAGSAQCPEMLMNGC